MGLEESHEESDDDQKVKGPTINYITYNQQQQQQQPQPRLQQPIMARQQPQQQQRRPPNILEEADAKVEKLNKEIEYLDRMVSSRIKKAKQYHEEGNKKGALHEASQIRELERDKQSKQDNLKLIQNAKRTHSKMYEFADSRKIIEQLSADKHRLAQYLDIESVQESDLDSRTLDRELEKTLEKVGITEQDRREDDLENEAFLQSILTIQPVQQQQQQNNTNNVMNNNANMVRRPITNNNNAQRAPNKGLSPVDNMLLL